MLPSRPWLGWVKKGEEQAPSRRNTVEAGLAGSLCRVTGDVTQLIACLFTVLSTLGWRLGTHKLVMVNPSTQRQEEQKFTIIPGYILSARLAWNS